MHIKQRAGEMHGSEGTEGGGLQQCLLAASSRSPPSPALRHPEVRLQARRAARRRQLVSGEDRARPPFILHALPELSNVAS
ncbi:unnamed protein product [Lampetra planeri]